MAAEAPGTLPVQLVEQPRLQKLKEMFISKFGSAPKFYVRAPGRVNLIGEHIDYCGYAVLPMAIEQDILIAVEPVKTQVVHLANTNSLYLDFSTSVNNIQINKTKPQWHNYFLCGLKGIQEHFGLNNPTGMNCLLDGTIPPSSGLSSSSALVCCAGLVTLRANGKTLSKVELAEICTKSERYIGTEGGGMDQSISFLAEEGAAKLIKFSPLRATDVRLPSGAAFVIANSCVEMNKAATSHYNIRVMECRLATKLLSKSKGLDWEKMLRLHDVQTNLGVSLEEMLTIVEEVLHPEPYSAEEICKCLGISLEELRSQILSQNTQDGFLKQPSSDSSPFYIVGAVRIKTPRGYCRNWDVEKDFTMREELQQRDVERWLGFITFLCEVFGTMRSSTGEPFRVLVCPIYTCLRELLQSQDVKEDAVLCCSMELQSSGRLLEEQLPEMMTELLAIARDKMLCPSESMLTRSLLLEVIELHANNWNPLTPTITQYYNKTIQKLTA